MIVLRKMPHFDQYAIPVLCEINIIGIIFICKHASTADGTARPRRLPPRPPLQRDCEAATLRRRRDPLWSPGRGWSSQTMWRSRCDFDTLAIKSNLGGL